MQEFSPSMIKAWQFWFLIFSSVIVSLLHVDVAWLNRDLDHKQRALVDRQETSATDAYYEDAWKQLVIKAYQVGSQDPQILDLIKDAGVNIKEGNPPPAPAVPPNNLPSPPSSVHLNGE